MTAATKAQVLAAVDVLAVVAETIRAVGSIPSGHLYAQMMAAGCSLAAYERIIAVLKGAGLVEESGHVLTWVGPKPDSSETKRERRP